MSEGKEKAIKNGIAGATAMVFQVVTLMPLRTIMNYQYKNGGTILSSWKKLHQNGGFTRFYRGLLPALVHAPLSRFGDISCNVAVISYLNSNDYSKNLPIVAKTFISTTTSILFRICIIPIDTLKSSLQVSGSTSLLKTRIKNNGIKTLWNGSFASMLSSFIATWTWFSTFNILDSKSDSKTRNVLIGATSSLVSGVCSNGFRVLKIYRQTNVDNISYIDSIKNVVKIDGVRGLFSRGLMVRLGLGCIQGGLFTFLWKEFERF